MDTRNISPNKPIDGTKFLEMLSTISLEDVLKFEFRRQQSKKWELMVASNEAPRKYQCCLCNVVQFGDRNLFSHLCGKKHNAMMISIPQLQIRMKPIGAPPKAAPESPKKKVTNPNANNNSNNKSNSPSVVKNANALNKNSPVQKKDSNFKKTGGNSAEKTQSIQKKSPIPAENTPEKCKPDSVGNQQNAKTVIDVKKNPVQSSENSAAKKVASNSTPAASKTTTNPTQKSSQNPVQKPSHKPTQSQKKPPLESLPNVKPTHKVDEPRNKILNIPNLVKNPLSHKIFCVPLAKLISSPEPEEVSEIASNVIVIDEDLKEQSKGSSKEAPKEGSKECSKEAPKAGSKEVPKSATIPILTGHFSNSQMRKEKDDRRTTKPEKIITPSQQAPREVVPDRIYGNTFDCSNSEILGLVGVEYVLKIVRSVSYKSGRYQCCLCDITADEQTMHNHLIGYNHRLKYFDKHFPTAMRYYRQSVFHVPEGDVCKVMMPIFDKLAAAIEKHHGREIPYMCYEYYYGKDRHTLISKVFNRGHASELSGPSFTHVVDSKEVDQLIENAKNKLEPLINVDNPVPYVQQFVPHNPSNYNSYPRATAPMAVDDETHKRMVEHFLRGNRHSLGDSHPFRGTKRTSTRSKSPESRKRAVSSMKGHWNVERKSLSPLRNGDIWQAYRHMVDQKVRELNVSFETYKADPEQHPSYQMEWEKFWKRRKDELVQAGINHRNYNFQNEWIHFFNARLEGLYNQDIEDIKIKCRERLCLPMTNDELANEKYHVYVTEMEEEEPPIRMSEPAKEVQKHPEVEAAPNVIHVLRLLTALEDYLGSLGPSVTEMLAKALQAQKLYPDRFHSVMLTSENCAILETAKEKFMGLLISQIYEPTKERALKRAVSDTENLLKLAAQYSSPKEQRSRNVSSPPAERRDTQLAFRDQSNPEKPLDKTELAAKLASSLVSQGKTSINREELQKILQVYNIIEQKKRQDGPGHSSENPVLSARANHNLISNPRPNDSPLAQHSVRNLNVANDETSSGQNFPANVARFNNNQNSNMRNSSNMEPWAMADHGDRQSGQYGTASGGLQASQFRAGPAAHHSRVLPTSLQMSSLFNFNTNLNPAYNLNRRNNNF
ncbi:hypothetical protein KR009_007435 [Drosophila setifemur]|nr:hypothetical protein KR009_007435 [Drosophila setifemur]